MDPSFEGKKLNSPEEELECIRQAGLEHARSFVERGVETTPSKIITDTVKAYAAAKPSEVLHPDYEMGRQEAAAVTLELSPEPHDGQMENLLGIVLEKGIRNAKTVVERTNNPHLLDDFHRFLVPFIASGHGISDLTDKNGLWKPLHMTLFEVSLP